MDDILRRMLEVERQAAQIVANAEAEAQRLRDDGRQKALAEGQRLRAEREKTAALSVAEERLLARARTFASDVRSKADQVLRELAYPLDASGH